MFIQLLSSGTPAGSCAKLVEHTTVGSAANCDLVLPDSGAISPVHATIGPGPAGWQIRDQGDLIPVLVNQTALGVGEARTLRLGDYIKIGTSVMQIVAQAPEGTLRPADAPASAPQQPAMLVQTQPATEYATRIAAERLAELGTHRGPSIDPLAMFGGPAPTSVAQGGGSSSTRSSNDLDAMFGLAGASTVRPAVPTLPVDSSLDPLALLGGPSRSPQASAYPEQRQQAGSAIHVPKSRPSDDDALDALFRPKD
ncbi:FHA domain-containing protein [Andreprevotia lacus]|jgi:hypothetical protein|nr:FHA domain-containing protein [Andreprevotia lacus]